MHAYLARGRVVTARAGLLQELLHGVASTALGFCLPQGCWLWLGSILGQAQPPTPASKPGSPQEDNDEVQHVPSTAQVGILVEEEAIGDDLHGSFNGEDGEEEVLQLLLWGCNWSHLGHKWAHTQGTWGAPPRRPLLHILYYYAGGAGVPGDLLWQRPAGKRWRVQLSPTFQRAWLTPLGLSPAARSPDLFIPGCLPLLPHVQVSVHSKAAGPYCRSPGWHCLPCSHLNPG